MLQSKITRNSRLIKTHLELRGKLDFQIVGDVELYHILHSRSELCGRMAQVIKNVMVMGVSFPFPLQLSITLTRARNRPEVSSAPKFSPHFKKKDLSTSQFFPANPQSQPFHRTSRSTRWTMTTQLINLSTPSKVKMRLSRRSLEDPTQSTCA